MEFGGFYYLVQSKKMYRTPLFFRILAASILISLLSWAAWSDNEEKDIPRVEMCKELGRRLELGELVPVSIFAAFIDSEARFDCVDKHGDRWNAKEYGITYTGADSESSFTNL